MKYLITIAFIVNVFSSKAQQTIPIAILKTGHIIIKAYVNGKKGNFIFDTGGGITLLTKKFSENLINSSSPDGNFTAFRATGERIDADLFTVDSISIGKFVNAKPTITIVDANLGGYDGLISLDLLRTQPFTIDYTRKVFVLESRKSTAEKKKDGKIINLQLRKDRDKSLDVFAYFVLNNSKTVQLSLDCGAGNDAFNFHSRYLSSCNLDITDTLNVKRIIKESEFNPDVKTVLYTGVVPLLQVKDNSEIKVWNFKARFTPGLIYDGIVSINWLGNILTFDLQNGLLIINN